MNELSHDLLSPIETNPPRNEWVEINRAAQMIAEGMVLENIAGNPDDRIALVYEMDSLYNAYDPHITVDEKPFLISVIEAPVAAKTTSLLRQQVKSGNVTNDLVHKIRDVPFGLNVLAHDLNVFVDDAVLEQKNTFSVVSKGEHDDKQYQANVLASIAANYGLNIPAVGSHLPSGGAFKTEQVHRLLKEINKIQDKNTRKLERDALEAFVTVGYAKQVKDFETLPGRMANQLSFLFENRTNRISGMATVALLGVAGQTLSGAAAYAAPPVENNENRKATSDLARNMLSNDTVKSVIAKSEKQLSSQQVEIAEKAVAAKQASVESVSTNEKNETPTVIAKVGARKEVQTEKPTLPSMRKDQDGRSVIIASPGVRAIPEKPQSPPSIRKDEDGRPVIIAKKDEKSKDRLNIVKVPLPATLRVTPSPETGIAAVSEVIIDPALASETLWTPDELVKIRANLDVYLEVQKETAVPWEIMAALHEREYDLLVENPRNGQGPFQIYSSKERFTPGPISREEFKRQAILAANFLKEKAKMGAVYGELLLSDPDKVKDVLFSYNGRASAYAQQAKNLGYNHPAEGSPYVMNLADDKRNSAKNPNWGQILTDNGPLGKANQKPGAWPLIEGLVKVNKIAHDRVAQKAADEKAAADAEQTKRASQLEKTVEEFTGWHKPVPANSKESPQYPDHKGQDYLVPSGTPFYAAVGGTVKVLEYNVMDMQFCKDAFSKIRASMDTIKDPIQKEVRITRIIDGNEYVTIYAHMSQIDVEDGQIVKGGQEIGKTGNSGCSTGDHAHFEVRKNGKAIDPNSLSDGDKWRVMGDIKPSSADKRDAQAKTTRNHAAEEQLHVHSSTEQLDTKDVRASGRSSNGDADMAHAKVEAMKRVLELKKQITASNTQSSKPVVSEGYLSVRR